MHLEEIFCPVFKASEGEMMEAGPEKIFWLLGVGSMDGGTPSC